jgi:hypothetical protein
MKNLASELRRTPFFSFSDFSINYILTLEYVVHIGLGESVSRRGDGGSQQRGAGHLLNLPNQTIIILPNQTTYILTNSCQVSYVRFSYKLNMFGIEKKGPKYSCVADRHQQIRL